MSEILVDSNVILDILTEDPQWFVIANMPLLTRDVLSCIFSIRSTHYTIGI